jgi:hypothetical protein
MGEQPASFRPHVVAQRLRDVAPVDVRWLWQDRIPYGKLTLLVGDPSVGKSFLSLDIATRLSTGVGWPDRQCVPITPRNTVIVTAEDDLADTVRPRLDAAGANVDRITAVVGTKRRRDRKHEWLCLDLDIPVLAEHVTAVEAGLLILDPITAYFSSKSDSHSNTDVRGVLGPLSDLAASTGCAVLAITHLNKGKAGRALYRAMGSLAFIAAARASWLLGRDPEHDSRRLFLPIKNNLVRDPSGLAFEIVDGRLEWSPNRIDVDTDSVLADDGEQTSRARAGDWLVSVLAPGPVLVSHLRATAEVAHIGWRSIERAKTDLGVTSARSGGVGGAGSWSWKLPLETPEE